MFLYLFSFVMQAHAGECPALTGKFLCGKGGKFTAEIEMTGPNSYRMQGPFDLPEVVIADGAEHWDPAGPEFYKASCNRGRLRVQLVTLRENSSGEKNVYLYVNDLYTLKDDGTIVRDRVSEKISELDAKSKMYCVPQR